MKTKKIISELKKYIQNDVDFKPYLSVIDEALNYISDNLKNYILDKQYQDISYIIINEVIFNLDEIYFTFKEYKN
jgi:hypothetical protein